MVEKEIPLRAIVVNQIEMPDPVDAADPRFEGLAPELIEKIRRLREHQQACSERSLQSYERLKGAYSGVPVVPIPMCYAADGFEILRNNSITLI